MTEAYCSEGQVSDACHLFSDGIMVLCRDNLFLTESTGCCKHSKEQRMYVNRAQGGTQCQVVSIKSAIL